MLINQPLESVKTGLSSQILIDRHDTGTTIVSYLIFLSYCFH
jgi:hypothetical protein